ncbi:DUF302 domain-containing protein [Enterovirga rhinocerotis]|uniref:DUF302 domain-containing protein n=1 Tax=Enterovirga rhinocerotis TaxID=1339210 RepID=UPI001414E98F|nr:DUF302 domain-containing protein [Enterovirga rhinocerotis]
MSPVGFVETISRLKRAIEGQDLWIVAEIDPQMLLSKGGFAILPTRQILFFHPRYMARLLSANAAGIVEAPLKFVIMERPDGTVILLYPEPGQSFAKHPGLSELGEELGQVVTRIADEMRTAPHHPSPQGP